MLLEKQWSSFAETENKQYLNEAMFQEFHLGKQEERIEFAYARRQIHGM